MGGWMVGWMRGGVDGWALSGALACNVWAGTLIFEENERSMMYMRYRKVLYCLRRTLIFESRLWKMGNEVSKSAVLCAQDAQNPARCSGN